MYYDWQGRRQRPSFSGVVTCIVVLVCALAYSLAVVIGQLAFGTSGGDKEVAVLNWLDFLYFLSYVKVRCCCQCEWRGEGNGTSFS